MSKPCLLFMYMVPQTGHQKAAEAIMGAASYMDPRIDCVGLDAGHQTYPMIGPVVNRMYLQMLKRAPFIWEFLYDNPEVEQATRDARDLLTFISSFRMSKILKTHRPVAVVCTQAAPAVAVAAQKRNGHLKAPLACVITDFGVHTYWIHPEADLYLVGHEDVKQDLIRRGIHADRIRVTGIPINPKFGETINSEEARRQLHMNPHKKTILIMGGGHGLGRLDELVEALIQVPFSLQLIVVCGRNKSLQKKIAKLTRGVPDIHILGYYKGTSLLMSAADILITKPGGLTCSEALAKQLPMILTNPIPGQEERNVRFLTKYQVARVARTVEDLLHIVIDLVRHPKKTDAMRQRARLISRPHAAWEAARLVFDLINKRGSFAEQP